MDWEFFSEPVAELILATAGLIILILVGLYVLSKLRGEIRDRGNPSVDLLAEFRELREKGLLTEKEYESIRANLTARAGIRPRNVGESEGSVASDSSEGANR
ncbi:MAG: hypothetical protein NZ899_06570 [Thermoguttaceae bacterium]|nr:hypothetical protein [Thermoguttaceae bacterium]MDW8078568.1 hypothetical protein [Thermoguttaceae bacterium]